MKTLMSLSRFSVAFLVLSLGLSGVLFAAEAKPQALICVSLMSETDEGKISQRVGNGAWVAIQLGDVIPVNAEIQVNVDRDWAEFVLQNDPTTVFYIEGTDKGAQTIKVADLQKTKARKVSLPKAGKVADPAFKDKLVAVQIMGRQIYRASPETRDQDVRYGDVLDAKGKVRIIGINNPLVVMFPDGKLVKVIGPLNFEVKKVLEGSPLYKYLNVTK